MKLISHSTIAIFSVAVGIASVVVDIQAASLNRQSVELMDEATRQSQALAAHCGHITKHQDIRDILPSQINLDNQTRGEMHDRNPAAQPHSFNSHPAIHASLLIPDTQRKGTNS